MQSTAHLVGAPVGWRSSAAAASAPRARPAPARALFGWGGDKAERAADKEEQFRIQQEVLARRRSDGWQKEVQARRSKVSKYLNDPEFKKKCDAENREKFLAKKALEPEVPKFGIIIPLIPIGLPEYDGGERFDLRLPYVDNGYVDDEADWTGGQALKTLGRLFGGGKKNKGDATAKQLKKKGGK